jgi:DNA-binding transcriptional MerR regulator
MQGTSADRDEAPAVTKSPEAFRTISEVAETLDVPPHVLRFWESRFTQVKPVKRGGGRRYYRPEDVRLLRGIRGLLYDDGMTIKGVQKILRERGVRHVIGLGTEPEAAAAAKPAPRRAAAAPKADAKPAARPAAKPAAKPKPAPVAASPAPQPDLFSAPPAPEAPSAAAAKLKPMDRAALRTLVGKLEALRVEMAGEPRR